MRTGTDVRSAGQGGRQRAAQGRILRGVLRSSSALPCPVLFCPVVPGVVLSGPVVP